MVYFLNSTILQQEITFLILNKEELYNLNNKYKINYLTNAHNLKLIFLIQY